MRSACMRLPGNPDQACDFVAEAIVDEYVRRDPESKLRLSVSGGRGVMFVCGDVLSQADFDVAALVRRTIGSLGITDDLEPFISLEPAASERVAMTRLSHEMPIVVSGYATSETPEGVPLTMSVARKASAALEGKRQRDPEWFWLGPDADVSVIADRRDVSQVIVTVEHGAEPLAGVRERITALVAPFALGAEIVVNPLGASERRGFSQVSGASNHLLAPYGFPLPSVPPCVGCDPGSAEKAGAWLARSLALQARERSGASAVLVQAAYLPGDVRPVWLSVRSEAGRDVRSEADLNTMDVQRVMRDWWRLGLCSDTLRAPFDPSIELPWEQKASLALLKT